jgi:hypothetical protein
MFFDHQQVMIIFKGPVALFITVEVLHAVLGGVKTREISKVKSGRPEPLMTYTTITIGVQPHENTPVLAQRIIHVPDVVGFVAVQAIVVHAAALVGTKFFVHSAFDRHAAFKAGFF